MRPPSSRLRRHRVALHAASRPAGAPAFAGLDGKPGTPYLGPDGTGMRCQLTPPKTVPAEVAAQGVALLRRTIYCNEDPLLQEPYPGAPPRKLARGDCMIVLVPADGRRWIAQGPMVPSRTGASGAAVTYKADFEVTQAGDQ